MAHSRARITRARRQRLRLRSRRRLRQNVKPTPETLAKLQPDPLWALLRRGRLTQEQVDAAHDIRTAYEIITAPVRAVQMRAVSTTQGSTYDMTPGSKSKPSDGESCRSVQLQQRFNKWVCVMKDKRLPVGPVIDVVVEGQSCRMVDRSRGRRKGWASDVLDRGLSLYVNASRGH